MIVCVRSGTSGAWSSCCFGRLRVRTYVKIKFTPTWSRFDNEISSRAAHLNKFESFWNRHWSMPHGTFFGIPNPKSQLWRFRIGIFHFMKDQKIIKIGILSPECGIFWKFFNRSIRMRLAYSAQNRNPRGFKNVFFLCIKYLLKTEIWLIIRDFFCLTGNNLTFSTRFNKIIFLLDHCHFWHVRSKKVFRNWFFNFLWWTYKSRYREFEDRM